VPATPGVAAATVAVARHGHRGGGGATPTVAAATLAVAAAWAAARSGSGIRF